MNLLTLVLTPCLLFAGQGTCKEAVDTTQGVSLAEKKEWDTWKITHSKTYANTKEEKLKMKIYMENRLKVEKHNMDRSQSYSLKMNQFGDMTSHEFNTMLNSCNM